MLIGFDVGGTKIEGVALDGDGTTLARRRIATPRGDYPAVVRAIAALAEAFESETGRRGAVGLGIPGSLSPATGLVRNANSTWLNGRPLGLDLKAALGRDVKIANDANCMAVSEAVDGAGRGQRVVLGVIIGTGCRSGIAIEGRAWNGRNGVAGEIGHNPLPWADGPEERPGPTCWCGLRGCVETFVSGPGFSRSHAEATGVELSAEAIVAAARDGDAGAKASVDRYRDRLARTLAAAVNTLDPEMVVLGGGMSNVSEIYDGLEEAIAARTFADRTETPVRPAQHGDASGVRGAAWLARA